MDDVVAHVEGVPAARQDAPHPASCKPCARRRAGRRAQDEAGQTRPSDLVGKGAHPRQRVCDGWRASTLTSSTARHHRPPGAAPAAGAARASTASRRAIRPGPGSACVCVCVRVGARAGARRLPQPPRAPSPAALCVDAPRTHTHTPHAPTHHGWQRRQTRPRRGAVMLTSYARFVAYTARARNALRTSSHRATGRGRLWQPGARAAWLVPRAPAGRFADLIAGRVGGAQRLRPDDRVPPPGAPRVGRRLLRGRAGWHELLSYLNTLPPRCPAWRPKLEPARPRATGDGARRPRVPIQWRQSCVGSAAGDAPSSPRSSRRVDWAGVMYID